jgi:hypothetical protein
MASNTAQQIELQDLERLRRAESSDFASALVAFFRQPDPQPEKPPAEGALTYPQVIQLLQSGRTKYAPQSRRQQGKEAWPRFLAQRGPLFPPRLQLADLLVRVYQDGTDAGRAALIEIARTTELRYGVWGGLKRIYKLAEQRHDAEMFGVLAWRFDVAFGQSYQAEPSSHTLLYLRRRAWRYLRELGRALPELYPQFAAEVLRHYEANTQYHGLWIANHIWAHNSKRYNHRSFSLYGALDDLVKNRAYDEAWKRSPEPLMRLLETCKYDLAAKFAIQSLRRDFPQVLRNVTPAWLDRLARRQLASAHEFLVETLQGSPEFHQGKLRGLGLHEAVLTLLLSPSAKARTYAIEYARGHAQDLAPERLADLLAEAPGDTQAFAASVLVSKQPRQLGVQLLGRLLSYPATLGWASKSLLEGFDRNEIKDAFLSELFYGVPNQRNFVVAYVGAKYQPNELPPSFWIKLLDDPRQADNAQARTEALNQLGKYTYGSIGAKWFLDALMRNELAPKVSQWLQKADSLPGLDVERVKALVFSPQHRQLALQILGNPKLVKARELSLPWLLALARRADPVLHQFAHRFLMQNMGPADFSEGGNAEQGVEKLFQLALGAKEPEPVRTFAQNYLRCHHPVIGPEQPDSKAMELKPQLTREAYTPERIWPTLRDNRDDVRKFAVTITRAELRRWNYQGRVYELAETEFKEVRNLAYDALLKAGDPAADVNFTLKPEELDPVQVFGMTESSKRSTREVAVELIRRNYARLGGAQRLAWLMESADREVRLFAVRLLWEKHRPRNLPKEWKPKGPNLAAEDAGRFGDVTALRNFLRRTLFGLPPGRSKEASEATPVRRLSASEAKHNVIEVVRDLGREDEAFAQVVLPVLQEFSGSLAKTEWQACLAALVALRAAHPSVSLGGN